MIFFLFLQISWQTVNRPYSDYEQELVVYFSIPHDKVRYVAEDSFFYTEYETQLKVYDEAGLQLAGDYWETKRLEDTLGIEDSIRIIIPKYSSYFELKILDLYAGQILNIRDKIVQINYVGNIRWDIVDDTLLLTFSVINPKGNATNMVCILKSLKETIPMKKGCYDDTLSFYTVALSNDDYDLSIAIFSPSAKLDEITIPIKISRPFYLDESSWFTKRSQLEYIATSSVISKLKEAKKSERDSLWYEFWKQHDPTPNTAYNEKEVEYFERIAYCEENFSHGDKGWRSDRARIYVKLGRPDEIQRRAYYTPPKTAFHYPGETFYDSFEIWYYYGINRQYIFGDRFGLGEYILLNPNGLRI